MSKQSDYLLGSLNALVHTLYLEHPKMSTELFELFRPEFQKSLQHGWNLVEGSHHSFYINKDVSTGSISTLRPNIPENQISRIPNATKAFSNSYANRYLLQLLNYFKKSDEEYAQAEPFFSAIETQIEAKEDHRAYKEKHLNALQLSLEKGAIETELGDISQCIYDYLDLKQPGILVQNILFYAIDSISQYFSKQVSEGDLFVEVWEFKKIFIYDFLDKVELILEERQGLPLPLFLKYTSLAHLYAKVCQFLIYSFSPDQKKLCPQLEEISLIMEERISNAIMPYMLYLSSPFYLRNSIEFILSENQIHYLNYDMKTIKQSPDFYERIRRFDFGIFPKRLAMQLR